MVLDMKTLIVVCVVINLIGAWTVAVAVQQNGKHFAGMIWWLGTVALQAIGFALKILRPETSPLISMILANTLIAAARICLLVGLERFLGFKGRHKNAAILMGVFVAATAYYSLARPDRPSREIVMSAMLAIIGCQICWLIFRKVSQELRELARITGLVVACNVLVSLARMVLLLLLPHQNADYFKAGIVGTSAIMLYIVLGTCLIISITLMVNKRLFSEVKSQEEKFTLAFHSAPYAIILTRLSDAVIFEVNASFVNITGYDYSDVLGKTTLELNLWCSKKERAKIVRELLSGREIHAIERRFRRKSGEVMTGLLSAAIIELNNEQCVLSTISDITELSEVKQKLEVLASRDTLTNLPNRLLFSKELEGVLSDKSRNASRCAVLFIDLDNFKIVNDTMGHYAGDQLLIETAGRLASCLREGDVLSRMGGDEFTVLLKDLRSSEAAGAIARRMLDQFSRPFELSESRIVIGASIGISTYPENAGDAAGMLKCADTAMYRAKELGRNNCQYFSDDLSLANLARLRMESDLRHAIAHGELKVYYQPIVDMRTMAISGAEALIRWEHPEKGMISPSLFVPVAEETGLILDLGMMVLETACRQCVDWESTCHQDFEISVNVSPVQLLDRHLLRKVGNILKRTSLPAKRLYMEITESSLAKNQHGENEVLKGLCDMGVNTCLDDFGIGYSSLSRLKDFPIIHMKVDGSFIRDIENSSDDKAMTESIITMAHNLGIKVTAEWIEDQGQMATLRALGCDYAQGFLISPALTADAFEGFVKEWDSRSKIQTPSPYSVRI